MKREGGTPIFTKEFLALDSAAIAKCVTSDGIFFTPHGLSQAAMAAIKADVAQTGFGFNRNWISGVYADRQFYLCHMLAASRTFTSLVTHPKVFEITDRLMGSSYRLKAHRYYETYGRHLMQWHTDNKTDRGVAPIPGIIFIAYLEDVSDGEFQYVRGSHEWSGEKAYNDYSDEFVEENFSKNINNFRGPAGTVVIYNTYGIHRAKPVSNASFVRKSLFWQIDQNIADAEPLLLNPAFLPAQMDERLLIYLGFGAPAEYGIFPDTGLRTLPLNHLPLGRMAGAAAWRAARRTYHILPAKLRTKIRNIRRGRP